MKIPESRFDEAVKKLGSMCLRYAVKMINAQKNSIASRYLKLALVYDENMEGTEEYQLLLNYLKGDKSAVEKFHTFTEQIIERKKSYDPPKGFIEIDSYGNRKR
jgi:hypothetical protein